MQGKWDMSYNWYVCYEEAESQILFFIEGRKSGRREGKITRHLPSLKGPRIPSKNLRLVWCQGVNPGLKFHLEFVTSDLSTCNYKQWNWLSPTFDQIHLIVFYSKNLPGRGEQTDLEWFECIICTAAGMKGVRGASGEDLHPREHKWDEAVSVKCAFNLREVWDFCC